jgi:hypothetical protein
MQLLGTPAVMDLAGFSRAESSCGAIASPRSFSRVEPKAEFYDRRVQAIYEKLKG